MKSFVVLREKSSQSHGFAGTLRDEKNRRFVSWACKGEVE
jgi:hypothetical protein